jgi:hypothetical protein
MLKVNFSELHRKKILQMRKKITIFSAYRYASYSEDMRHNTGIQR